MNRQFDASPICKCIPLIVPLAEAVKKTSSSLKSVIAEIASCLRIFRKLPLESDD
jgi:hypothetical protein